MPFKVRFIDNVDEPLRTVDANQEFLASLGRITTDFPPVHTCSTGWKFEGFYNGPTSIAYLFYRLSHVFPDILDVLTVELLTHIAVRFRAVLQHYLGIS